MMKTQVAIDPMALLFPPGVYAKLIEKIHPHVPSLREIQAVLRDATPAEIKDIKARVKAVSESLNVVNDAVSKAAE